VNIPAINQISKSEPSIFERLDKIQKEDIKLKQIQNGPIENEKNKKTIIKKKLIHSSNLEITTNLDRKDSINDKVNSFSKTPKRTSPISNTKIRRLNKQSNSPIRLSRSISHETFHQNNQTLNSNNNSPKSRKYDTNFSTSHK
jgi:hypothetical protein